jgi:hypothetical protein
MKAIPKISFVLVAAIIAAFVLAGNSSCNIYRFNEAGSIPDSIKTVKVNFIDNKAQYKNPQLSQKLTEKLRQKIVGQTKLSQTNSDNADWEISGTITQYAFSTSAISGQQVATNRLTVAVHIILDKRKADDVKEYDVSRSFEFKGNQSFQQAEIALLDEMTRTLIDEIFNKLFSDW